VKLGQYCFIVRDATGKCSLRLLQAGAVIGGASAHRDAAPRTAVIVGEPESCGAS
jgi:hypothetical protein